MYILILSGFHSNNYTSKLLIFSRSLQHPHMLSLLGVKYHEGSTVLIMNLVDGQDLSTLLFGNKKVTEFISLKALT